MCGSGRRGVVGGLLKCNNGHGPDEGKDVGAEAISILYRERNQDVLMSVDNTDGLSGSLVNVELAVLRLLSGIARYRGHMWGGNVSIDGTNYRIDDNVSTLGKQIQDDHVF